MTTDFWVIFIPMGVLIVSIAGLFLHNSTTYLSIREHETYDSFVKRELNRIHTRLSVLETTRPTTGELEAKLGAKKEPPKEK